MLRITYEMLANHFLIQRGQVIKTVKEPPSTRTVELSVDNGKVTSTSEESRSLTLSDAATFEPDPGNVDEDSPPFDENEILERALRYNANVLLSLYTEKRSIEDEFLRKQRIHFFTVRILDENDYTYADIDIGKLETILMMHSLPKKEMDVSTLPFLLSRNVVGHIFHEYVHTLEMDILECDVDTVVGTPLFEDLEGLDVYEDPTLQTVGHSIVSDEGRRARKTPLIDGNTLVGFLDSSLYPFKDKSCGYLGYGQSYFPVPRSTNLCVKGKCEHHDIGIYIEVTGLNLDLHSLDPLATDASISGGEGLYVMEGAPLCRVTFALTWKGTIQELLSGISFSEMETALPPLGGICVKNGILFRSAQTAPPALWKNVRKLK